MNEIIQESKTKELALKNALERLGVGEEEVDVEVMTEAREGILGGLLGSRNCKLRVTLKDNGEEAEEYQEPASELEETRETHEPEPEEEPEEPGEIDEPERETRAEPISLGDLVFDDEDMPTDDRVRNFILQVLRCLDADCQVDVEDNQNDIEVEISGEDSGVIIGKFGQTLDSLQYLTNVIMGKKIGNRKKVIINVGDYRERREKSLKQLSRNVARKVAQSQKSEALAPMSPQDRRVVHLSLSNFKNISTSSEGTGINRKVIISFED